MRGFSLLSVSPNSTILNQDDIIIAGMSYEGGVNFNRLLYTRGIFNIVYYNTVPESLVTFETILEHKIKMLTLFPMLDSFFESDLEQFKALKSQFPGMEFINS